jgi:threonine/homoserine efflux transporter RhtA
MDPRSGRQEKVDMDGVFSFCPSLLFITAGGSFGMGMFFWLGPFGTDALDVWLAQLLVTTCALPAVVGVCPLWAVWPSRRRKIAVVGIILNALFLVFWYYHTGVWIMRTWM